MAQYAFISWLFRDNSGFNIIYSFTYFNKIIHNIELYGLEKMSINKPLYVDTLEEVKNNSIKELQEKYLKNVELGYIEDNTINN